MDGGDMWGNGEEDMGEVARREGGGGAWGR